MHIKLTDTVVHKHLKTPGILRDSILTGFGVRIYTSGKASYIIEPTVQGATQRKVIGKFPLLSVDQARGLAKEKIQELSVPARSKSYSPATFPSLESAFESYITNIRLKPSTLYEYNKVFRLYLKQFHNLRIDEITEEMVIPVYLENCNKRSVAQSNKSMKIMQAVLRYSGLPDNPVQVLSRKRLIRQPKPKTSYIPLQDLALFYKGLSELKHSHVRLYLELLLHTGLRAGEAMQITSSSVATGVLIIRDTKNHSDHHIPLTQWLTDSLMPFLGANPDGFTSMDIRKSLLTACKYLPYTVTRHDLRRTFASYASEAGCDYLLIKRALNHSVNDITARYIQTSPNSLRPVFEAVADLILHNK